MKSIRSLKELKQLLEFTIKDGKPFMPHHESMKNITAALLGHHNSGLPLEKEEARTVKNLKAKAEKHEVSLESAVHAFSSRFCESDADLDNFHEEAKSWLPEAEKGLDHIKSYAPHIHAIYHDPDNWPGEAAWNKANRNKKP